MTAKSIDELKKVMAELISIDNNKLIETPAYLRHELLQKMQKMLIVLNAINKK